MSMDEIYGHVFKYRDSLPEMLRLRTYSLNQYKGKDELYDSETQSKLNLFDFLRPVVSFVAIEIPKDGDLTEDDLRTAAELTIPERNQQSDLNIISLFPRQETPTIRYAGSLEVKTRASISPDLWRNNFSDLSLNAAALLPNTNVAVYEINGLREMHFSISDALRDALKYISQRPAGTETTSAQTF